MMDNAFRLVRSASRPRDPCFVRAFVLSILVISALTAKVVHLCSHFDSLPVLLYILYLPTFFLQDFVVLVGGRLLLHPGRYFRIRAAVAALLCFMTLIAASAQVAFYLETGGEIRWSAASNFAHDPAGLKLLGSGSLYAGFTTFFITVLARVTTPILYKFTGQVLLALWTLCRPKSQALRPTFIDQDIESEAETLPSFSKIGKEHERLLSPDASTQKTEDKVSAHPSRSKPSLQLWLRRLYAIIPIFLICLLSIIRPGRSPYGHLSDGLPFTLRKTFMAPKSDFCTSGHLFHQAPFPLPEVLKNGRWEPSQGSHDIWRPIDHGSSNETQTNLDKSRFEWLPEDGFEGFEGWYRPETGEDMDRLAHCSKCQFYDPAVDPMKISNLQEPILAPILEEIKKKQIFVKHVVLFNLESTRKDVFPLKNDSHLHREIESRLNPNENSNYLKKELDKLSHNARFITGELNNTDELNFATLEDLMPWQKQVLNGRGGINVDGVVTGGTLTAKSLIESHCGIEPLPVDFSEEVDLTFYQPCLPHILNLFNNNKLRAQKSHEPSSRAAILARPWRSVFAQAITDKFDRQDKLDEKIGFHDIITRKQILDETAKYYPPDLPENNYFGFPEQVLKPYLRDIFQDAEQQGQRVFLSHITSTTHHPWNFPVSAGPSIPFLKPTRWGKERPFNRYLNTIKYEDDWIGEFMNLLQEIGVANETLIVFVGDHAMSFRHDSKVVTTFENPHISSFQVPLVFYHPQLPRIQLSISSAKPRSILPTILDLLIHSSSMDERDTAMAWSLLPQYQGQSMIRPYIKREQETGREAWAVSVVNAGGALLSIASAASPFRLVIPLCKASAFRFTNLATDPHEKHPKEFWTMDQLIKHVRQTEGVEAATWVRNANDVGMWWAQEQKRLWRYNGQGSQDDKDPKKAGETGQFKHEHWWNT